MELLVIFAGSVIGSALGSALGKVVIFYINGGN